LDGQIGRQAAGQTDTKKERQTGRQTDRQTVRHILLSGIGRNDVTL
jgi:hypothetical protein